MVLLARAKDQSIAEHTQTYHILVTQAQLRPGQVIGIVGSGGGLGHLGIQFAKAAGLKVVGIDARDEGLELSYEAGADLVLDARETKDTTVSQVMDYTAGGCDATINVSEASTAATLACAITRLHGKMIQIAQPENVSVPFEELIFRNIKIEGSLIASAKQGDEMLDVVAQHGITVKTSPFYGLDQVNKLVEFYHSGNLQGKGIVIVE